MLLAAAVYLAELMGKDSDRQPYEANAVCKRLLADLFDGFSYGKFIEI